MFFPFLFLALAAIVIPIAVAIPEERKHHRSTDDGVATIHDASKQTVAGYTPQMVNTSTGNPANCSSGSKFFLQLTNHNATSVTNSNSTFLQQYQIIDTYYKPGGPIFFFQGMETDKLTCLETTMFPTWAKELNALAVGLEHRYFGASCPYGLNYSQAATWPVSAWDQLLLDNVMSDAATFLGWVKTQYDGAADAKVIMSSASYGGTLTVHGRVKYPDVFWGALAASPLTLGLQSDPTSPYVNMWGDWATQVFNGYSFDAAQKIRASMKTLHNLISSGNLTSLQKDFNLCEPAKTQQDGDFLMYTIMESSVQAAEEDVAPGGFPFQQLMNATLALPPNASYVDVLKLPLAGAGPCVSLDPQYSLRWSYRYLQCKYFPQQDPFTTNTSLWGELSPSIFLNSTHESLLDPWCEAAFGFPSVKGGSAYQASLGLDLDNVKNTTRLLISGGLRDPVTAGGYPPWYPGQHTLEASVVQLISGAGHGANILANSPYDTQALTEAKTFDLNMFKAWLSGADE